MAQSTPTTIGNMNATDATGDDDSRPDYSGQRSVVEIAILSMVVAILILFSFFGNLLVVVCIRWNRRLRQETGNIFLANLGITDMSNAVFVMTATLQSIGFDGWVLPIFWCKLVCTMNYVLIIVSMLTLSFIAVDRYTAVTRALVYETIVTKRRVLAFVSYAWFQGLVFGIAPSAMHWVHYDYWEMVCAINWDTDSYGTVIYVLAAFTLCFIVPGAVLIVCYWKIMNVAKGLSASVMPSRQKGVSVSTPAAKKSDHKDNNTLTHTGKVGDINVTGNDSAIRYTEMDNAIKEESGDGEGGERKNGERLHESIEEPATAQYHMEMVNSIKEGENGKKEHGEEQEKKERFHLSVGEPVSVAGANLVTDTPTPEVVTTADVSRPSNVGPSRGDTPQAKSMCRTLCTKISCPIRCCFCSATRREESMATKAAAEAPKRGAYSSSKKAIRSLLIVVVAFFVCMTPFCITKVYKVILHDDTAPSGHVNTLATIFQYCSSAINPLIYGIFRRDFRKVFKWRLRRMFCKSSANGSFMESETFSF